ncbi:sodium/proton antiporter, CPA1 family (TC 2.A.36) [Hymenobacter roseosalivarius DSM 11622]|uniref:Sodium/proton antiporter, CPA1 family (TC 2.A.36) n=1 Tax=Hymenobacter roseosalivarius DSM 11622 TaxID=645990 RepID=A0A1W1VXF8_9BACT|nr:sodium:proton antiporter [Hymenobacter roseosalivarius]SMB98057.1 sodium/proton antiporter, CPA1 family (TC 2.A.36) [Hymenobacter roseosalivarius DSM 11622]
MPAFYFLLSLRMKLYNVFAVLMVVAASFGYLNHRFLRLPSTIGLMVLALVSSLLLVGLGRLGVSSVLTIVELVRSVDFNTILMQVMLSFLLFAGAIHVDAESLGEERVPVFALATIGTLTSTLLVATTMYFLLPLFGLPTNFIYCLLFGALISPTDPIAVLGILKQARIPKNLEIKVVGESLFNDGIAVVVFVSLFQIAQVGWEELGPSGVAILFLQEAVGGILLGALLGYGGYRLLRSIDNYKVEVLITLALVTGGTALAAALHTSGPLAIVVAGLIVGQQGRSLGMSDTTREYVDKFWEIIDEILNAVLFVLIGLEILVVQLGLTDLLVGAVAIVVVLLARLVAVALPLGVLRFRRSFTEHSVKILTWGGLRGGISVALALSLPPSPARDLIVGITYVVVIFSIIVQGLTIGPLVKRLGLSIAEVSAEEQGNN